MRIDCIFRTGLVIIEIQTLQNLEVLLNFIIGQDGFAGGILQFRTIFVRTMVNNRIAAYIEPLGS